MVTIRTSSSSNQAGISLVELLVTLAVLSFATGIGASVLKRSLPAMAVDSAWSVLDTDLKRARLTARTRGTAIEITPVADGYKVPALDIERRIEGIRLDWSSGAGLVFRPDGTASGGQIRLSKHHATRQLTIDPFTGHIR